MILLGPNIVIMWSDHLVENYYAGERLTTTIFDYILQFAVVCLGLYLFRRPIFLTLDIRLTIDGN